MSVPVKKVELKSRPDLNLFVRSFTAAEAFDQQDQFAEVPDSGRNNVAMMLSVYLSDEAGKRLLPTLDSAFEFMSTVKPGVTKKLILEGQRFNALTDEALEEELKK